MNNKGYTYTGVLINILVATFLLPIIVSSLRILVDMKQSSIDLQNEIGVMQLRRDLITAYDLYADTDCLYFSYQNEDTRLVFNNRHLYRTPGTVIYLEDIDYAVFEERGNHIYLIYYQNENEFERIIY